MNQQQLAEQMQCLIDFRDVTLADVLAENVFIIGGDLRTASVVANLDGQEWLPEIVYADHVDSLGVTRRLKFKANLVRYKVEIDE